MARIAVDPNYSSPTFPRATAGTDLFVKEDVQALAAAVSTHDHTAGKGLGIGASAIPNGSVTLAKLAADSVDSSKIVDGTIATADLANASVTNAKLATDTARANLLTNGGFEIWQRGNGPFTATTAYTADRWALGINAPATISVSRDTANADIGGVYCAAVSYVRGAGSGPDVLTQSIGPTDTTQVVRGKTITFSVRVKTATANAVRLRMNDGVTGVTNSAYHTGGGAYETLSLTYTISAANTALTTSIQFDASCTAYVDNAMLVVGSVAADYAPLHPADDLARCLRYYEKFGPSPYIPFIRGYNGITTGVNQTIVFAAKKAITPTLTSGGTWAFVNTSAIQLQGPDIAGFAFGAVPTASGDCVAQSNNSGYIVAEANP